MPMRRHYLDVNGLVNPYQFPHNTDARISQSGGVTRRKGPHHM
jgi:hypothetical protein